MRLRILRSFESRAAAASSNRFLALPAIYQFQELGGARQVEFQSAILFGFREALVFEHRDLSATTSQATQSAGNQERQQCSRGEGHFSPSFPEPSAGPLRTNA